MDSRKHYQELASKWLNGTISREEMVEFSAWYNQQEDELVVPSHFVRNEAEHKQRIRRKIQAAIQEQSMHHRAKRKQLVWKLAVAATVLIVCGVAAFWLSQKSLFTKSEPYVLYEKEVTPGVTKATLTLATGEQIALDGKNEDASATHGGLQITTLEDGVVTLQVADAAKQEHLDVEKVSWNTIRTPAGGEIKIKLPDQSMVYLNAASSITFPTRFSGTERRVILSGEAYFEVEKSQLANHHQPFIVEAEQQEINVLGTTFNVQAYVNESNIITTLMSGAVKLTAKGDGEASNGRILKPGQQAMVNKMNGKIQIATVDLDEAMAWKEGYFVFNNEGIKSIMAKISRWYDIDVSYQGKVDSVRFLGVYDREKNLQKLLKDIELTGKVSCKIISDNHSEKGRRIMVMAK